MTGKRAALTAAAIVLVAFVLGLVAVLVGGDNDAGASGSASSTPRPTASPIQSAPGGGSVTETIAPGKPGPTRAADVSKAGRLPGGLTVRVLGIKRTSVKPGGPGEAGGPAAVVRLGVENGSKAPIRVGSVVVTLVYGDNQVAQPLTSDPYAPFTGHVKPGAVSRGTYVFRVPSRSYRTIGIRVEFPAGGGVVRFTP